MELKTLLTVIRRVKSPTVFVPFILINSTGIIQSCLHASNPIVQIPLQFDKDGAFGHTSRSLSNYMEANIYQTGKGLVSDNVLIPLVLAKKTNSDDVKISTQEYGGTIWGWFPKDAA